MTSAEKSIRENCGLFLTRLAATYKGVPTYTHIGEHRCIRVCNATRARDTPIMCRPEWALCKATETYGRVYMDALWDIGDGMLLMLMWSASIIETSSLHYKTLWIVNNARVNNPSVDKAHYFRA